MFSRGKFAVPEIATCRFEYYAKLQVASLPLLAVLCLDRVSPSIRLARAASRQTTSCGESPSHRQPRFRHLRTEVPKKICVRLDAFKMQSFACGCFLLAHNVRFTFRQSGTRLFRRSCSRLTRSMTSVPRSRPPPFSRKRRFGKSLVDCLWRPSLRCVFKGGSGGCLWRCVFGTVLNYPLQNVFRSFWERFGDVLLLDMSFRMLCSSGSHVIIRFHGLYHFFGGGPPKQITPICLHACVVLCENGADAQ